MANGYQPTKGETWGEEPVAHTFDLTHRIRGLSTPTTSTLDTHASFFAVFSLAKHSRPPPKVTTKPHTETHPYTYIYPHPLRQTPDHPPPRLCRVGAYVVACCRVIVANCYVLRVCPASGTCRHRVAVATVGAHRVAVACSSLRIVLKLQTIEPVFTVAHRCEQIERR